MTDEQDVTIARLEERGKSQSSRLDKLEANQRWGVISIVTLGVNAVILWAGSGAPI